MAIKWRKYSGTSNSIETETSDVNPLPVAATLTGGATEAKQDSQIVLATALNALVTTIKNQQLTNEDLYKVLQEIRDGYDMDVTIDKATVSRRALLQTGSTTAVTGTLTAVTTVGGITNIGGADASSFIKDNSFQEWAFATRNLLN